MQSNFIAQTGLPVSHSQVAFKADLAGQTLEDNLLLDELSAQKIDRELTAAALARTMGKSVRMLQSMEISAQLKGDKVSAPKSEEWRIQKSKASVCSKPETDSAAGSDKVGLLEARIEEMHKRMVALLCQQEMASERAERVYRQCFAMLTRAPI
jgi:hypothetical protein